MKQVAIAFATTGNSPKAGHRISEMVLVEQVKGKRVGEAVRFELGEELKFPAVLERLKAIVGDAPIIVHDGGKWRRFMRAELRQIKRHGAARLVAKVVDVRAWAHQRFPRQRRDVAAIAKRLGIEVEAKLAGLEREAELLRLIASKMEAPVESVAAGPGEALVGASKAQAAPVAPVVAGRNWVDRIGRFWRELTGRA